MSTNISYSSFNLPPLPSYTLTPQPPLVPPIPDKWLTMLLPIIAYWGLSMFFHWIDTMDYFPQYRLHTPAEVAKRNRVSRWEVVRDVIIQQVVQTVVGLLIGMTEPDDFTGKEEYDIAVWAQRIRLSQRLIPGFLALLGLNAKGLATNLSASHPKLAGALLGGQYPTLTTLLSSSNGDPKVIPSFASWELLLASAIYHYIVPALQFGLAILIVDTWQYFLHRLMHTSRYLYTTFHSRHHRLYVPYAYGALYNHPFEGFLLDTLGAGMAFKIAGMTTRQGMCFFSGSTIKTVDDHCGYALPFDPLQRITSNNAGYHDVHHQSWGIKTNFSQPFFTFWDRVLGTKWTGGDVSARYEKARVAAQKAVDADSDPTSYDTSITHSSPDEPANDQSKTGKLYDSNLSPSQCPSSIPQTDQQPLHTHGKAEFQAAASRQQILDDPSPAGGPDVLKEEAAEEKEARETLRRSPRKRAKSSTSKETFAGLRERVSGKGGHHGRGPGVLGVESAIWVSCPQSRFYVLYIQVWRVNGTGNQLRSRLFCSLPPCSLMVRLLGVLK